MIEIVTPVDGISTASGDLLCVDYVSSTQWRYIALEGATINSPNTLFTQTDTSSQGEQDLINYVINYTP